MQQKIIERPWIEPKLTWLLFTQRSCLKHPQNLANTSLTIPRNNPTIMKPDMLLVPLISLHNKFALSLQS